MVASDVARQGTAALTLIVWDIDGTLTRLASNARPDSWGRAFQQVFGTEVPVLNKSATGRTALFLLREQLRAAGHTFNAQSTADFFAAFNAIEVAHIEADRADARRLYGRADAISMAQRVAASERFAQVIVTGNTQPVARAKLKSLQVAHLFDLECSAFGDDEIDRGDITAKAVEATATKHRSLPPLRIIAVGDTAHDQAAAASVGAEFYFVRDEAVSNAPASRNLVVPADWERLYADLLNGLGS